YLCYFLFFFFIFLFFFFFSSRRRHTRFSRDWSSDVCSSDLLVLLIIATSVGATLYYTNKENGLSFLGSNAQANTETSTVVNQNVLTTTTIKPIFTSLDPFTVTLSDGIRSRILHVAITLRVEYDDSRRLLNEFMPMVRDRILKTLSAQDPFHVQTPEG